MSEIFTQFGSSVATLMFLYTMYQNYFPNQLRNQIKRYSKKFTSFFYPYIQITFNEFEGDSWFERSKAFSSIERYLGKNSSSQAKRLKARVLRESEVVVLSMDDYEEVNDEFEGVKLWWASSQIPPNRQSISFYPREDEKRFFTLTFHKKHRKVVTESYLKHVLDEGKEIAVQQRQRKLFTNNKSEGGGYGRRRLWSHVMFNHPASFNTLAMEATKKKEIIDDLETFSRSKEYYGKIGKAWKRGYLLFGPPGTGKSTMIAAMANFLKYDVYDLELTAVKDNTELRRLLIDTSSKSIIVIEDIDCSLDLTGQREKKKMEKKKGDSGEKKDEDKSKVEKELKKDEDKKGSEVTLSGLLNCIDGLWSTCGEERIFVFTTNYVEKLDPALIRRGRMDKHIELSYCCFESFKVLAKNYWNLDSHELFPTIEKLLEETKMTPADVAENLMPKSSDDNGDTCLERLIKGFDIVKEEARLKAEEEKKEKAEEEERLKAEKEKEEEEKLKAEKEKEEEEKKKQENGVASPNDVKENGHVSEK
ncbi:hypothetical protein LIER_18553 [Lithospermum erythrorhizon]|uniref:AAA+ ATPase domain-containing protein n=1 Tax=Lithospermum erythrorhizon TaxID=34254 RepID=A0AAV3QEK4_LITER